MSESPAGITFERQFADACKAVFREIVAGDLARGGNAEEQARAYAARANPEFVLAYLLATSLPDEARREIYALAFDRRAALTEERAREFDRTFHRSFALLFAEAAKDRAAARAIRSGRAPRAQAERSLPVR
jgi:hypothetical protein